MKNQNYKEIINLSWQRTLTVLFRPFRLKKWMFLGLIVIFAGQLGGFNFNFNLKGADKINMQFNAIPEVISQNFALVFLILLAAIAILAIILLWIFIKSVFSFIFIESLRKDEASIRIPFHRNKALGASYYRFSVGFFLAIVFLMGALAAGAFFTKIFFPFILAAIIAFIFIVIISVFVEDFLLVIMYSENTGIKSAWQKFLPLLAQNAGSFFSYLLIKLLLGIAALIIGIALTILGVIALILIGGGIGLIGFLIYSIIPAGLVKLVALWILVVVAVPIISFLAFLARLIVLPIGVFFRLFSIFFLGSVSLEYDIFAKEPAKEDPQKYKKSMAIVWLAIFAPLVPIALIIGAIFLVVPDMAKASLEKTGQPNIQSVIMQKVQPLKQNLIVVHLKNGRKIEASLEREDAESVTLSVKGGTFTFNRRDIEKIERTKGR
ncbi:MAG: hypothetical protein ISS92_03760 [Candidatus Omnitrophica bacterium]|nr:hypothetical protein [Candidatus Omnitrophota bacterium]